jgi:hypothetical protein
VPRGGTAGRVRAALAEGGPSLAAGRLLHRLRRSPR